MQSSHSRPLAVITGGSKGIGAGLIREFCSRGFQVVTYARDESLLSLLRQEMEGYGQDSLIYQPVDALSTEQIMRFAAFVNSLQKPVDVLINNAGYFEPGHLMREAEGTMEKVMQVNVYSAYHLTRALMPQMQERKSGHIFNLCSVASLKAYPAGGSYSVAKTALLGFTRNLREELRESGIRVTAVMPGATYTDSWASSGLPEERFIPVADLTRLIWTCYDLSSRTVVEEILLRPQLGDI